MRLFSFICVASILIACQSTAATFTAGLFACPSGTLPTDTSDRSQTSSNSTVSVSCGSVIRGSLEATGRASSGPGTLSAYASAIATRMDSALVVFTNTSRTFAVFNDTISVNWLGTGEALTSGSASLEVDVLGGVSGGGIGSFSLSSGSTSLISESASGSSIFDSVSTTSVLFSNGAFSLSGSVSAWANAVAPIVPNATNFTVADLGSSMRLTGLSIFDDSGADITALVSVTSESGFDYVEGATPHDRGDDVDISPVPLPATGWMLIVGLGGLLTMRRRRHV